MGFGGIGADNHLASDDSLEGARQGLDRRLGRARVRDPIDRPPLEVPAWKALRRLKTMRGDGAACSAGRARDVRDHASHGPMNVHNGPMTVQVVQAQPLRRHGASQ